MSDSLVTIKSKKQDGVSRRGFLKVLGSTTAAAVATGCADPHKENIYPNLKGQEHQVPGFAVHYASTCTECSAGCGITVRTREGRAVKIEGNPNHPVNKGSLCGLGQSALQSLYDPDRIREPLLKTIDDATGKIVYKPISWNDALAKVATALVEPGKSKFLFTKDFTGTLSNLTKEFSKSFGVDHIVYDPLDASEIAESTKLVFGEYGIPTYKFDRADVILSLGADYLETWTSPTEYARQWAEKRRSKKPQIVFHAEPRLSLTAANADKWLGVKPGGEIALAKFILRELLTKGSRGNASDADISKLKSLVSGLEPYALSQESGVSVEKMLVVASKLSEAKESLVVAGGAAARSEKAVELQVLVHFINIVLGNIGRSVQLTSLRKPKSSLSNVQDAIDSITKNKPSVVMFWETNPVFTLPVSSKLKTALQSVKPGLVVSFSSHLDETTSLADIILPTHHSLESWGDTEPFDGVKSVIQPTMQPVFDTKPFGDILITFARAAQKEDFIKGTKTFEEFLKKSWEEDFSKKSSTGGTFVDFWRKSLEKGGVFDAAQNGGSAKPSQISASAFTLDFNLKSKVTKGAEKGIPVLPFYTVKGFDGRAANRPWLQEIPDPLSLVMWDSWAELHPNTAHEFGLKTGDTTTLRNAYGEVNVPVVVTEQIIEGIVAVPVGQGHEAYGRFAKVVKGGNVFDLVASENKNLKVLPLVGSSVTVQKAQFKTLLSQSQITQDQMGRDIAKTKFLNTDGSEYKDPHHAHGGHHGEGEPKQMYEQREHPLYHWGMVVDLSSCTGCSACVVACYAENNIAVVGKSITAMGREMSWLSIHKYVDGGGSHGEEFTVSFQPMMCQHCQNAPCEPVCPVYATYHNEEGMNAMVYNRCVGTRYCSNNCTYKVRRFNWYEFDIPETYQWQLNPDVTRRTVGIMEKCTFCVQRIVSAKDHAKDEGRIVRDGEVTPACVQTCPTQALTFGNLKDPESRVSKLSKAKGGYKVLDSHINTQPSVTYIEDVKYKV